jgi:hypothetical protein
MIRSASDVYDRVKRRIGLLARRQHDELLTPTDEDDDVLQSYLEEGLRRLATVTGRLEDTVVLGTVDGRPRIFRPSHIYLVQEAEIYDNGSSYNLDLKDGQEIARKAQAPDATKGRPCEIGTHGVGYWLWPVPDSDNYEIRLQVQMNGTFTTTGTLRTEHELVDEDGTQLYDEDGIPLAVVTFDKADAPDLNDVVNAVPQELHRAMIEYVVAEWFADVGQLELAARPRQLFEQEIRRYKTDPNRQRTATRPYNPLGF